MSRKAIALTGLLALGACSHPKPVLYPTEFYNLQNPEKVKADTEECEAKANEFLKAHKSEIVAKKTLGGAIFGAFLGIVTGAFTGDYARAVSEGAAVGAAAGAAHGAVRANTPDGVYMRFTDYCLAQKGYQPIGWK
ncbi:MAG: hypothetical protein HY077_07405 [Elusimicrobia bacterium]|nr:hypothetical protein [Elusimicrobiota bacterium]